MHGIGIDIGGTKCAAVLGQQTADSELVVVAKRRFPTRPTVDETLQELKQAIECLLQDHALSPSNLAGIGIVCGGPLDSRQGRILSPPNLPGWEDIPVTAYFEGAFGVRARLLNDADAGALAEWRYGAGQGCRNLVFLTFGTGLGAGLILNGSLYSGTNDMAGEIGHVRMAESGPVGYGKAGALEGFCSGGGIAQIGRMLVAEQLQQGREPLLLSRAGDMQGIDARRIAELAQAGDPLCQEVYRISGEKLGAGLSILIDLLNPEKIILGSIFVRCRALLWQACARVLEREALASSAGVCEVVPAGLGEQIGDYAALTVAYMDQ